MAAAAVEAWQQQQRQQQDQDLRMAAATVAASAVVTAATAEAAKKEIKWVDFDWAGVHSETAYPGIINMQVRWAAGVGSVGPGVKMLQQHDVETLQQQFDWAFVG